MNSSDSNLSAILTKIPASYLHSNFDQHFFEQELSNLFQVSDTNTVVPKNIISSAPPSTSPPQKSSNTNPFVNSNDNSTSEELESTNPFKNDKKQQPPPPDYRNILSEPVISDKLTLQKITEYHFKLKKLASLTQAQIQTEVKCRHADFIKELHNITKLTTELHSSSILCAKTRQKIKLSAQNIAHPLFNLTDAHHSREKLVTVNSYLKTIKSLKCQLNLLDTYIESNQLLKATEAYCKLYQETFKLKKYEKFIALQVEITKRLDQANLSIDKKLNNSLEKIAKLEFDSKNYKETLQCYSKLNKIQNVAEIILIHFLQSIQESALSIAFSHNNLEKLKKDDDSGGVSALDYELVELCKNVPGEEYLECLLGMCSVMWKVMINYVKLVKWHVENSEDTFLDRLNRNRSRIWKDIEENVRVFLTAGNLAKQFRFDQFITVLNIIGKLNDVGRDFVEEGHSSENMGKILQESIHAQCLLYLERYHADKLEEMTNFMMIESWSAMPLVDGFSLSSLHEFSFLQSRVTNAKKGSEKAVELGRTSYFEENEGYKSPFMIFVENSENGTRIAQRDGTIRENP